MAGLMYGFKHAKGASKGGPPSLKRHLESPSLLKPLKLPNLGQADANSLGAASALPNAASGLGAVGPLGAASGPSAGAGAGVGGLGGLSTLLGSTAPGGLGGSSSAGGIGSGLSGLPGLGGNATSALNALLASTQPGGAPLGAGIPGGPLGGTLGGAGPLAGPLGVNLPGAATPGSAGHGLGALGSPLGNAASLPGPGALGGPAGTQQTLSVDILQSKVPTLLGSQASMLNAIKAMSGASCTINHQGAKPGMASVTISGTAAEVEKCKSLVLTAVDGTPSGGEMGGSAASPLAGVPGLGGLQAIPKLAGPELPAMAPAAAPSISPDAISALANALGASGGAPSTGPTADASGLATLAALATSSSAGSGGVGGAGSLDLSKLGSLLAGLASGGGGAGNLTAALGTLGGGAGNTANALGGQSYAELMTTALQVAGGMPTAQPEVQPVQQAQAFDREALARLAKQAQENQASEAEAAEAAAAEAARAQAVAQAAAAAAAEAAATATAAAATPAVNVAPSVSSFMIPGLSLEGSSALPALDSSALLTDGRAVAEAAETAAASAKAAASAAAAALRAAAAAGAPAAVLGAAAPPELQQPAPMQSQAPSLVQEAPSPALPPAQSPAQAPEAKPTFTMADFAPAVSSAPPRAQKDASSVLGILQQAQANIASQRAVRARGVAANAAPSQGETSASSSSTGPAATSSTAGVLEVLNRKIQDAASAPPEIRRALEREVLSTLPKLDPARAADLVVRVHNVEAMRSRELLDALCQALASGIPRFGSSHLTRLTSAFSRWAYTVDGATSEEKLRLSEAARGFFNGVSNEVSLRLMDIAPRDLGTMATALSSVGLGSVRLFASLARAAVARSDRFAPSDLVALVHAFEKARFFHSSLFEALAKNLRANVKDCPPRDLLQGMKSLAACGVRDDGLGQAIGEHVPQKMLKGDWSAEEFCALAWVFCVLDLHHDKMFRAVFRALEDAAGLSNETLCQLFEIHLALKAFHNESYNAYELEDDTVQSLRDHYKKQRGGAERQFKLERPSEKIHSDVAGILRDVIEGSVSTQHQTSLGFVVDVAATRRRSSTAFMFLDVDGPHSLVRSLDPMDSTGMGHTSRARGHVLLKRRIIQKNGFRIAAVTEDGWRALNGDREKREYLRELLKNAGVSQDRLV